jgi:hypothetical protein
VTQPTEVLEARIQDSIVAEMAKIGGAGVWRMTAAPLVAAGLPADPVPETSKHQVYVQYASTEMVPEGAGTVTRLARAHFNIVCMALDADANVGLRMVLNLKADVLRAVYAAEAAFFSAYGYGIWVQGFSYDASMSNVGVAVGVQDVFVDFEMSTTAP